MSHKLFFKKFKNNVSKRENKKKVESRQPKRLKI